MINLDKYTKATTECIIVKPDAFDRKQIEN